MKRYICSGHVHKVGRKPVIIDSTKCGICKKENKVGPLKVARAFKIAADDMEFLVENPNYDPIGITVQNSATRAIQLYVKMIHPAYAKNLIDFLKDLK